MLNKDWLYFYLTVHTIKAYSVKQGLALLLSYSVHYKGMYTLLNKDWLYFYLTAYIIKAYSVKQGLALLLYYSVHYKGIQC